MEIKIANLRISEEAHPELYAALADLQHKARAERLRSLANIGLLVARGALSASPNLLQGSDFGQPSGQGRGHSSAKRVSQGSANVGKAEDPHAVSDGEPEAESESEAGKQGGIADQADGEERDVASPSATDEQLQPDKGNSARRKALIERVRSGLK